MNVISTIINLGTSRQTDVVSNRHIRFANSSSLIICCFIVQNTVLSLYYKQPLIALIHFMHLVVMAAIPVINHRGVFIFNF